MQLERIPGKCSQEVNDGIFSGYMNVYDAYVAIDILCFVLLLYWIRQQHQRTSRGYFSPENPVVFSVYLWLLVANAVAALYQALILSYSDSLVTSEIWAWVVASLYGSTYGAYHVVIEGTTCLLLSPGIGKRSMRRSLMFGLVYGVITTVLVAFWIHSPGLDIAPVLSRNPSVGQYTAFALWNGSNGLMYLILWVAPQRGRWARRPAAVYWGRFFFLYRLVALAAAVIVNQGYDFGVCLAHANVAAIFCGLRTWITFRVFVLETCWWHGVPVRVPPLCCECCYNGGDKNNERYCCGGCTCVLSSLTFCLSLGCCMGRSSDESSQLSSTMNTGNSRGHTNSVDGTNKLNILDGVDLTQSAAVAMSAVRDELGVPRGASVAGPLSAEAARDAAAVTAEVNSEKRSISESTRALEAISPTGKSFRERNQNEESDAVRKLSRESRSRSRFGLAVNSMRSKFKLGMSSGNLSSRSVRGRGASAAAGAAQARAPLLDFAKLQVMTSKILGMGSTARVYQGSWCGRPCAVKVLFTVEITAEEVQRTCYEASLLFNLQSPHVVRVYGVAVLPPSLCVVLELCSHGSLTDLIYTPAPPELQEPLEAPRTPKSSSLSGSAHGLISSHLGRGSSNGSSNRSSGSRNFNTGKSTSTSSPLQSPQPSPRLSSRLGALSSSSSSSDPNSGNSANTSEPPLSLETTSFLFGSFTGGGSLLSSSMFAGPNTSVFTETSGNSVPMNNSLNTNASTNIAQRMSQSFHGRSSAGRGSSALAATESFRLRKDVVRGGASSPSISSSPLNDNVAGYQGSSFDVMCPSDTENSRGTVNLPAYHSNSVVGEGGAKFWEYQASQDVESGGTIGKNGTTSGHELKQNSSRSSLASTLPSSSSTSVSKAATCPPSALPPSSSVLGWLSSSMSGSGARSTSRSGSKNFQSQEFAWQENAARNQLPQVTPVVEQLPPPPPHFLHPLPWEECLELMLGAAEGLAALVRSKPGFSHNDVKSANFLVHDPSTINSSPGGANWPAQQGASSLEGTATARNSRRSLIVKLADLEFASCGVTPPHLLAASAAVNWTAPEVLSQAAPVSPASDVYSLAMTMFEIATRQIPFAQIPNISERVQAGGRPRFPRPLNILGVYSSKDGSNKINTLDDLNNTHRASMAAFLDEDDIGSSSHADFHAASAESKNDSGTSVEAKRKSSAAVVAAQEVAMRAAAALAALIARGHANDAACEEASRAHIEALIAQAWSQDPSERPTAAECATAITEELDRYLLSLADAAQAAASVPSFSSAAAAVQPPLLNLNRSSSSATTAPRPLGGSTFAMLPRRSSELEMGQVGEKVVAPSPLMAHHVSSPQLPSDSELVQQSLLPPPAAASASQSLLPDKPVPTPPQQPEGPSPTGPEQSMASQATPHVSVASKRMSGSASFLLDPNAMKALSTNTEPHLEAPSHAEDRAESATGALEANEGSFL